MTVFTSPFGDIALRDQTITERVFEGLKMRPEATALIDGPTGRKITGADLMAAIQSLAGGMAARGIGPGTVIGLMAPNIPEFVSVFHGTVYAGATVTTINPSYTAQEVRHQLQDAGAHLLITIPDILPVAQDALTGTAVEEIVVIGDAAGATPLTDLMGPPLRAQVPVDLDDHIAVLPYSSGTTGLPKGVMLSHRNLVVNVDQVSGVVGLKPGEITPAFLPFFHIYGLQVMVNIYLSAGAAIATLPRFDLELFLRLAQDHRAERLWIVPPVAIALAKHPMIDDFDLASVIQVNSAAAPMGPELGAAVHERMGCAVTQAYGMTELSPASHVMAADSGRAGAVGRTIAGTLCRIVDPGTGKDMGVDEEGELWIKGPQVMKGYLNNPKATAENIVEGGWLRTGDIGCIDADDYLFIRDRLKELIKVKGFQVAPAELEGILLDHPEIADAGVIGRADPEAGEVPVAYIQRAPGSDISADTVKAHLVGQLAHYKHLADVVFVDEVPKSASGKILRRMLRASDEKRG
jgi:acyl-CoA synthetase (AMP-forming)/AMP-acid ligase II